MSKMVSLLQSAVEDSSLEIKRLKKASGFKSNQYLPQSNEEILNRLEELEKRAFKPFETKSLYEQSSGQE